MDGNLASVIPLLVISTKKKRPQGMENKAMGTNLVLRFIGSEVADRRSWG